MPLLPIGDTCAASLDHPGIIDGQADEPCAAQTLTRGDIDPKACLFRTILMDPPWSAESGGGKIKRGADRHYPLLKTPEVIRVLLSSELWRPAPDSHCWIWVTNTTLANGEAHQLMRALGYRPITFLTWVKSRIGLGQYLRGMTEHVMLGVRGKGASIRIGTGRTVIHAPRSRHSAKPEEAFRMIESVSPAPRVEFFARTRRPGWEAFGNEI